MNLRRIFLLPTLLLLLAGCGRTVTVKLPPRVDLHAFGTIGVVEFTTPVPSPLGAEATQKFIADLQAAQPGVRILELGPRAKVLREIGRPEFDHQAVRALGRQYGVEAVFTGTVEFSPLRPDIDFGRNLTDLKARIKLDGRMSAKLWETSSGASLWSNSSWGNWSVAGLSLTEAGPSHLDYRPPQEQQDRILTALVEALNRGSFWPRYEKRRVD
jgi:hypothetical protein